MTEQIKNLTERRIEICYRCDKHIDKENDGYATRLVEDEFGRTFRLWYCSGCIIMGKFP